MSRNPQLLTRRVRQTLSFTNGPGILLALASQKTPWRREELTFQLPGGGVVICPNQPGARVPVYEVFAEDAYRISEITADLPEDFVALDIGGHIGCFSIALAKAAPAATVHTFEASPSTASWLRRNIEANSLGDRVVPHSWAVSGSRGTLEFADNARGSSLNGLTAPMGSTVPVQVRAVTIDDAVQEAGGRVDLVKIDTEGAEYDMLAGTTARTWAGVRRVVMEYHDVPGHGWPEVEQLFREAGLTVSRHEPVSDRQGTVWLSRDS